MLKSMTGYGSFEGSDELCAQSWEIKSVNSKQFNLRWRLPSALLAQEVEWERLVREFAERGRVEISLKLGLLKSGNGLYSLNLPLARGILNELRGLAKENHDEFVPDYMRLATMNGLWQENKLIGQEELLHSLEKGLRLALEDWDASRVREGGFLGEDILLRVRELKKLRQRIEGFSKDLPGKKFSSLKLRLEEYLESRLVQEDQDRMLQEMALMADRLDLSEEVVRLESHLDTLEQMLSVEGARGRRLDFLLQECFREVNTCSNKAQDAEVSRLAVEMKNELEKCREQVQNLE